MKSSGEPYYLRLARTRAERKSSPERVTDTGRNLGTAASAPQSAGLGAKHHRFPGTSRPIPMTQNLFPLVGGRLHATRPVALLPPGN